MLGCPQASVLTEMNTQSQRLSREKSDVVLGAKPFAPNIAS